MDYLEIFDNLYKYNRFDLNEKYFRLNHIINNFNYIYIDNVIESNKSLLEYVNKNIILENRYNDNNIKGRLNNNWRQSLYVYDICKGDNICNKLDIQLNFINLSKDQSFLCKGQFVIDEYKNIIFIVQDHYYFNRINQEDIKDRITEFENIIEKHYIQSQLDIFVFRINVYKYFDKENVEYLLKTTLSNSEIKISIESIEILNKYGNILKSIESKHIIQLNLIEWENFINKNMESINFTIYKHSFDLNTHISKKTKKFIDNNIYNFWTIKKGIDIFYVCNKNENSDNIDYHIVYLKDIKTSKYFNSIELTIDKSFVEKGFWYNYIYNNNLNKFIPIVSLIE